ncbi:MAG: type III secretion system inner membrane ring subunit SctD, partial [Pseudomonadota bacterium]
GKYTIGTGDECDLVLRDRSLQDHHATLEIASDHALITPDEGMVNVNGRALEAAIRLDDFEPILMGSTGLALGPPDTDWPDIDFAPQSVSTNGAQTPSERTDTPVVNDEPATSVGAPQSPADETTAQGDDAPLPKKRVLWAAVIAGVVLFILAGAVLWAVTDPDGSAQVAEADPETIGEQAKGAIHELELSNDVKVVEDGDAGSEVVTVEGYVETRAQRQALVDALQEISSAIVIQVWATDLLRSSLNDALSGTSAPLQIAAIDRGDVELEGVLPDQSAITTIRARILEDVPGIKSLKMNVITVADASAWIGEAMARLAISSDTVKISIEDKALIAEGTLADGSRTAWHDLVTEFGSQFGQSVVLEDRVTFSAAPAAQALQFNFSVRAINLGPPPYVTLGNGQKYTEGSLLPNGMTLSGIRANSLVLQADGATHIVTIEAEKGTVDDVNTEKSNNLDASTTQ